MAKRRRRAARQQRGGLGRERQVRGVRQRVDPGVDAHEAPDAKAAIDRTGVDTSIEELRPRQAGTLICSYLADARLDRILVSDAYPSTSEQRDGP